MQTRVGMFISLRGGLYKLVRFANWCIRTERWYILSVNGRVRCECERRYPKTWNHQKTRQYDANVRHYRGKNAQLFVCNRADNTSCARCRPFLRWLAMIHTTIHIRVPHNVHMFTPVYKQHMVSNRKRQSHIEIGRLQKLEQKRAAKCRKRAVARKAEMHLPGPKKGMRVLILSYASHTYIWWYHSTQNLEKSSLRACVQIQVLIHVWFIYICYYLCMYVCMYVCMYIIII